MIIHPIKPYNQNVKFQKNDLTKDKYKNLSEKRAYIDSKIGYLDDVALITSLGALGTGVFNIGPVAKDAKPSKLSIGLIILAFLLIAYKGIKSHQLSKQYDKELSNDTKNYA